MKKRLGYTTTKIKCEQGNEDMISDTEMLKFKNIGYDQCPVWYYLKCTKFVGKPY